METTVNDAKATENSSISDSMISSPDFVPSKGDAAGDTTSTDAAVNTDAAKTADTGKKADDESAVVDQAAGDKSKNLEDRFDKDPRFKEVIDQRNKEREARIAAETKLELLKKSPLEFTNSKGEKVEIIDISKMSPDELREWQEDDPKGYADNLVAIAKQQVKADLSTEEVRTKTIEGIEKTFEDYGKENPDFNAMWDSGEIPNYMKTHPGNNALSAHMALTGGKKMQAMVDAAVAKAVKETEERVTKNFQAKRNATIINPETPTRGADKGVDAELADTQPHGGFVNVAAKRLAEMRRASM